MSIKLYNIYITKSEKNNETVQSKNEHRKNVFDSHIWIHDDELKKNLIDKSVNFSVEYVKSKYGIGFHNQVSLTEVNIKDVFRDIQRINKLDITTSHLRLCKLFEEVGEFSRAINMKLGRKMTNLTDEQIIEEIKEEAADAIQCLLSFADTYELDYSFFKDQFINDSHKPDGTSPEFIILKVFKYVGGIVYRFEKNHPELIYQFNRCISKILSLTSYYGIRESEILEKILQKNIKWEKIVNKRNKNERTQRS